MLSKHAKLARLVKKRSGANQSEIMLRRGSRVLDYFGEQAFIEGAAVAPDGTKETEASWLPSGLALPKSTLLVLKSVITTPKQDRDRDILETAGAIPAKRNPLLWQHDATKPVGKALAVLQHDAKVLKFASALLALKGNEALTDDCAVLIEADVLGISHGFRALEWDTLKDEMGEELGGFHITKFEIMEHSLVSVPSNTDALVEQFSRGKLASREARRLAEEADEKRAKTYKAAVVPETKDTSSKEVAGKTKAYGSMQYLDGSWEAMERDLHEALSRHLQANGIKMPYGVYACSIGTFADYAVVVVCGRGESGSWHDFYKISWAMKDGAPQWSGEPVKVKVETVVSEAGLGEWMEKLINTVNVPGDGSGQTGVNAKKDGSGAESSQENKSQEVVKSSEPEMSALGRYIRDADLPALRRGAKLLTKLADEAEREENERALKEALGL